MGIFYNSKAKASQTDLGDTALVEYLNLYLLRLLGDSVLKLSSSESVSDDERKNIQWHQMQWGKSSGNWSCRGED